MFKFEKTDIDGLWVIKPKMFRDERGTIVKHFEKKMFKENGLDFECVEAITSVSGKGFFEGFTFKKISHRKKLLPFLVVLFWTSQSICAKVQGLSGAIKRLT